MSETEADRKTIASPDPAPGEKPSTTPPKIREGVPYFTMAQVVPEPRSITDAVPRRSNQGLESGLSKARDLEVIEGSFAPGVGGGPPVPHVRGPAQNPVDPILAGLDVHDVQTGETQRQAVTLTGRAASGREPATYVDKTGGAPVVKDSEVAPTAHPED